MAQTYDVLSADAVDLNDKVATLVVKDNYDEALKLAEDAAKAKDPKSAAAALRVASLVNLAKASKPPVEGAMAEALKAAQASVEASERAKYPAGVAAGLTLVARAHVLGKKEQEALKAAEDALAKFQAIPHQAGEAFALCTSAKVYLLVGRNQKAFESATKAVGMFRDLGDPKGEAMARHALVDTYMAMKKYSDALQATERMLEIFQGLSDTFGQGFAKTLSAEVNVANDCKQDAVVDAQEASKLFKKVGAYGKMGIVNKLGAEAAIAELLADDALEMAERAVQCFKQAGDKFGHAAAQITMSQYYSKAGEYDKATYRAENAAEAFKKLGETAEAAASMRTACLAFLDKKQYDPKAGESVTREAMRTATASLRLYESISDDASVGFASSTNTLAQAHLAAGDLDQAMEKAEEAQALFRKLDYPVGTASTLNTIAQVTFKRGETFDAVSLAKEAQQLFQENDDEEGADFAAYLVDFFQAPPEEEGGEPGEVEVKAEKKKAGPSISGLGDLIPGGAAAVKPIASYDAYEGRSATAPGQRRQASAVAAEGAMGPAKEEALFCVRWVAAKNMSTSAEAVAGRNSASRVIKRGMVSGGGAAPGGIVPSRLSSAGLPVF